MELEKMGKPGLGTAHLRNFKKQASYFLRDSLKVARLAFVDVSAAELMTEDATNAEEWGPTTTAMASISDASYNSEDYLRIVQVLHKRFSSDGKKYWREIQKSLTLLQYLLTHGPDYLVMEFRNDKDLDQFVRFEYVDENMVDRGSVIQKKTKQIQQLLMDEQFYKGERRRAQKVSKGIHGFGSHSVRQRSGSFNTVSNNQGIERAPAAKQPPRGCHVENDSTLVQPKGLISQRGLQKSYTHLGTPGRCVSENLANAYNDHNSSMLSESGVSSPSTSQCTSESNWSAFTTSPVGDRSSARSTTSTEWNPFEESPSGDETWASPSSPIHVKCMRNWPNSQNPLIFKLPPPPASTIPAYKIVVPAPPPGGSKVGRHTLHNPRAGEVGPDLISF